MGELRFEFTCLYSDAGDFPGDLDVLYRLVAERFQVCIDHDEIFGEPNFAVVEFAQAVSSWLSGGFAQGKELVFAPLSYEGRAMLFQRESDGWWIDSDFRAPEVPRGLVGEQELRASLLDFSARLAEEAQILGIDLDAVLDRLGSYAADHTSPQQSG